MPFSGFFFLNLYYMYYSYLVFQDCDILHEQFLNATPLREKEKHCHITYWIFSLHKTQINKDNFRYHEIVLMKVYTTLLCFLCRKIGKMSHILNLC